MFSSCAAKTVQVPVSDQTIRLTPNPVLTASVASVRAQRDGYDFKVTLHNQTYDPVLVYLGEMNCYRGTRPGTLKQSLYDRSERVLNFAAGQSVDVNLQCRHAEGPQGDYRIGIPKVYAVEADGRAGKVLARELMLTISPDGGWKN